jgi:hypothetical protein
MYLNADHVTAEVQLLFQSRSDVALQFSVIFHVTFSFVSST